MVCWKNIGKMNLDSGVCRKHAASCCCCCCCWLVGCDAMQCTSGIGSFWNKHDKPLSVYACEQHVTGACYQQVHARTHTLVKHSWPRTSLLTTVSAHIAIKHVRICHRPLCSNRHSYRSLHITIYSMLSLLLAILSCLSHKLVVRNLLLGPETVVVLIDNIPMLSEWTGSYKNFGRHQHP